MWRKQYLIVIFLLLGAMGLLVEGSGLTGKTMVDNTSKVQPEAPTRDTFTVNGVDVLITRSGGRETLQINGRVVEFHRSEKGYLLKRDVFRKPAQTLREAVERYLESETAK